MISYHTIDGKTNKIFEENFEVRKNNILKINYDIFNDSNLRI
jgi:hypothetical protein